MIEQMMVDAIDELFSMDDMRPIVTDYQSDQRRLETLKAHRDALGLSPSLQGLSAVDVLSRSTARFPPTLQGLPVVDLLTRSSVIGDTRVNTPGFARHPTVQVPHGEDPARYIAQ